MLYFSASILPFASHSRAIPGPQVCPLCQTYDISESLVVLSATVLQSDTNCNLIPRDIYNAKAMVREEQLAGRTPMEMLLDELQANNILSAYDRDDQGRITKLFFAPSLCVQPAREFPHVIIMDCTYEVNR